MAMSKMLLPSSSHLDNDEYTEYNTLIVSGEVSPVRPGEGAEGLEELK